MTRLLALQTILAVEGKPQAMFDLVLSVIAEAARDRQVWDRIMALMPDLCPLIEEEWGEPLG